MDGITNECKLIEEHLNQIDHDIKILEEQIFNEKGDFQQFLYREDYS